MNRRLIRPSLSDIREQATQKQPPGARRKPVPPEQTYAESYYYVKQMQARTPIVVILTDGEVLRGIIEWYDKECIKITRTGTPNLLVYKTSIKYVYKDEDAADATDQPQEPELAHASKEND